ncbi:unnamed protein product, partial [marine sediment metagenome]
MSKTIARIFAGLIAAASCLSACLLLAGPFWAAGNGAVGTAMTAQASSSENRPASKREQADDLLRRARRAMAENNVEAAQALLTRAE